jgi:hypothetical protein
MQLNVLHKEFFIEDADENKTDTTIFVNKECIERIAIEKIQEDHFILKIDYTSGIGFTRDFSNKKIIEEYLVNKFGFKYKSE